MPSGACRESSAKFQAGGEEHIGRVRAVCVCLVCGCASVFHHFVLNVFK